MSIQPSARFDIGPDAGSINSRSPVRQEIARRQHDKQRRGIDAAVVAAKGNFFERGHFAAAHFVQDFSRLGVLFGNFLGSLLLGQILQHASRDMRSDPQTLKRGDDSVAAKRGVEPGHAGVRILTFGISVGQHAQIGFRAFQPGIHAFIGSGNLAFVKALIRIAMMQSIEGAVIRGVGAAMESRSQETVTKTDCSFLGSSVNS